MRRRRHLAGLGTVGLAATAGCLGLLPTPDRDAEPALPGGTLVVDNEAETAVPVRVTTPGGTAVLDRSVPAGGSVVRERFVTAATGETRTLRARVGDATAPLTFRFLPAGGSSEDVPPEVASLTLTGPTRAAATWTASPGRPTTTR